MSNTARYGRSGLHSHAPGLHGHVPGLHSECVAATAMCLASTATCLPLHRHMPAPPRPHACHSLGSFNRPRCALLTQPCQTLPLRSR